VSETTLTDDVAEDAESLTAQVTKSNVGYVGSELAAGRWTDLRFLRFRPERELADMLDLAERVARARAQDDPEVIDVEEAVGADPVVGTLRDALRVHAPANQVSGCPAGYTAIPYPLNVEDRERLYGSTSRVLQDVLPRYLPGGDEGWSWRVEPQVAADGSALLIRLTPRNSRFEDPIEHAQSVEQQMIPPVEEPPAGS
jgi:hypothetical protein